MFLTSNTHREDLPEQQPLNRKDEPSFTTPTGRFGVGESSSVVAARQAGHTLAHRVDYGFVDTVDASIHDFESR
ncbi:hypothetical protein Tco_1440106 [Tanacetum coccineum]